MEERIQIYGSTKEEIIFPGEVREDREEMGLEG